MDDVELSISQISLKRFIVSYRKMPSTICWTSTTSSGCRDARPCYQDVKRTIRTQNLVFRIFRLKIMLLKNFKVRGRQRISTKFSMTSFDLRFRGVSVC